MVSSLHAAILATLLVTTTAVAMTGIAYMGGSSVSPRADRLPTVHGTVVSYVTVEIRHDGGSILERRPLSECDVVSATEGCRPYRTDQPTGSPDAPADPVGRPIASNEGQADTKSPG